MEDSPWTLHENESKLHAGKDLRYLKLPGLQLTLGVRCLKGLVLGLRSGKPGVLERELGASTGLPFNATLTVA